ncbi:RNA polymerase sigma-70 factor, Bacteroides expansion family 1 [Pedobacter steynii]|uniref:RNA polymerase sigma-70 factor, Bacteroides expansion family 1 n=1 Tax=Pedobacter steynii TaxID=430522 RepID=A0A1G9RX25_9SPHI|nr:RNA polymerase sigma-70 factor [Pedobacter steynii]NQX37619.1 RNA polymerase sigma-70 factor [Pedobacter steynii]SDM27714.1 RNA polymerase sigma-70 factor, Bacteroides expansion family 1 [Pedobacter steynii]
MYSDRFAYHSLTDFELTKLLISGDSDAFIEIYNRFQALMYVYACKITMDKEEAEDIVQEVFIYLWDKRTTVILRSSLSSYLYSAVRYKFFNLLDHQKVRKDYRLSFQNFLDQGEYITDNYIREKEFSQLIEKEIAALPDKMREIFELSRKQNLSRKEISEKLNVSEKTVKNQINNALKILRGKLGFFPFLLLLINK